jgi:hypothetical protein
MHHEITIGFALALLLAATSAAHAGADPAAVCKNAKAKAAGKEASDVLKAHGKNKKKRSDAKLAASISKAESKLTKSFTKAEDKGGCGTTGDAAQIDAKVDAFVLDAIRDIDPLAAVGETFDIPSAAEPAETPGSPGVVVTKPELITQFGGAGFSLNNARYTRWRARGPAQTPDAIVIMVAGFGGGANNFKLMAEDLIPRVLEDHGLILEVWGFHRRTNQLEDREGIVIAQAEGDPLIALDWYYGDDLGLSLHPALVAGPNRRAFFYNTSDDIPFIANFTQLVHSQDIDAVVETARSIVDNVFLGGHSAGVGFTARYAATDFNLTGVGSPDPGYAKLRGLVMLEGGANTTTTPATEAELDKIEDRFDGGLFAAVRDADSRCVDGSPCGDDSDCTGLGNGTCTESTTAYAAVLGLSPQVTAVSEPVAIQRLSDPDSGQVIVQVDLGAPGNNAVAQVPELGILAILPPSTVDGVLGGFLDDDGLAASANASIATSLGAPGPVVNGLQTWLGIADGQPMPPSVIPDNGPAPTMLPADHWGQEKEVVRLGRYADQFLATGHNAADWYYSQSGLGMTSPLGLDTTQLSVGRDRRDIANQTQAANIDIPVISFGGSNGNTSVPGDFVSFAESIGTCTAPSCDGSTPRVVDDMNPSEAFPTLGDVAGGYEAHISEGFAHQDVTVAENDANNNVIGPLSDFIARNVQ